MFNWIPLIGNWSPVLLLSLTVIIPAMLGGSMFAARMTIRDRTIMISDWVSPVIIGWLLIGSFVFAISLSSIAANFVFDSWVLVGLFIALSIFLLPLAVIIIGEWSDSDRYSEYRQYSTSRAVITAVAETVIVLISFLAILVIAMIGIVGILALLGPITGVDTSNFFNPITFFVIVCAFMFSSVAIGSGS